ncbi:hypothetical protein AVEN_29304-1 [Araneus ventricosus]|uniref:DUF4218 domain-containing protein n=1 Tax=Araneus ventricosus TaxID=182803 RepID=A0A4Y2V1H4_ARAVE|nr:hypothetical protein AVEN_29304-1 [Araneus ventricosus]
MPLSYQLKMKLENEDLINNILTYKSKFQSNCDTYRDTMDGDLYRSIDGLRDSSNLSIQFNVDGIPLYRKSNDAPARCAMQNFKQFNGKFGCGFCEQEGLRVAKGKGHCQIYPFNGQVAAKRTFENCVRNAEEALATDKSVKGVKGTSVLMNLYPNFNMVDGFIPDYMHCVLLGVTRQLVCLFVESSGSLYSLRAKDIRRLDIRIRDLKLPHEATRKLRTTKDISFWKASEWRIFLLTSPVLLKNILNHTVYKHWLLFVHGITLLLGTNISRDDIAKAEDCLKRFVSGVKDIYGIAEQSYNIHLLLHLSATVKAWGPLWANSCFVFEDALGKLKTLHHGTKAVPMQITSAYTSKSLLGVLVSKQEIRNHQILKFIEEMQAKHAVTKKVTNINGCMLYGKPTYRNLLRTEEKAILKLLGDQLISTRVQFYNRMCYLGHIFSCKDYCSKFIHADYAVSLSSRNCVEIHRIIVLNGEVYFIGENIPATKFLMCYPQVGSLCSNILSISDDDAQCKSKTIAFKPFDVINKYVILPMTEKSVTYFIPINVAEY